MNKKITLTNFWIDKQNKLAINCKTQEEARTFLLLSNKLGKVFNLGNMLSDDGVWSDYREKTCYTNDGSYDDIETIKSYEYKILNFSDLNLETKSLVQKDFTKNIGKEVYILVNTFNSKAKNIKMAKGIIVDFMQDTMSYCIDIPYSFRAKLLEQNVPIIDNLYVKPSCWNGTTQITVPVNAKNNFRRLLKEAKGVSRSPYIFTFIQPDISKIYRKFLNAEKRYKTHLTHIKQKYFINMIFVKRYGVKNFEEFEKNFFEKCIFGGILSGISEEDFNKCFYFSDNLKQDLKKLYYYHFHNKEFVYKNLEEFNSGNPYIKLEYPILKDRYGIELSTNKNATTNIGASLLNIIKERKEIEPKIKIKANIVMFCKFNSSRNSEYYIDINKLYKILNRVKFVPLDESEINIETINTKEEPSE